MRRFAAASDQQDSLGMLIGLVSRRLGWWSGSLARDG